jgi:hypothetical protein
VIQCQLCDGECSWTRDTITFFPNVQAHCCVDCANKVADQIERLPEWQRIMELDAMIVHYDHLAQAGTPVTEEAILEVVKAKADAKLALRPKVIELVKPAKVAR